jgi:hypothetical protein
MLSREHTKIKKHKNKKQKKTKEERRKKQKKRKIFEFLDDRSHQTKSLKMQRSF